MNRADIVDTARGYLGTKYVHQGRVKGLGIDCLGLLICVGRELGFLPGDYDHQDYTHQPSHAEFMVGLEEYLVRIDIADAGPGDILMLDAGGSPVHVGFKTDRGLLHAYAPAGKVVEHGLRAQFATSVRFAFRVPGSSNG